MDAPFCIGLSPVFRRHPLSGEVLGVRWNETDRGPINTLSFDDVGRFYAHTRTLQVRLVAADVTPDVTYVASVVTSDGHPPTTRCRRPLRRAPTSSQLLSLPPYLYRMLPFVPRCAFPTG